MFGDDPDPTVMTARVGSGKFRTRTQRGVRPSRSTGKRKPEWSGMVNEDKRSDNMPRSQAEKQQLLTATSFKKTRACNAHDAMR